MKISFALLSSFLIWISSMSAFAQQKLSGVYGGVEFRVSALIGGGMSRKDRVIFFRPDGSYNDDWNVGNWKTNSTGTYIYSAGTVKLHSQKTGKEQVFTMGKDGNLAGRGFKLFKLASVSQVPKGTFEYQNASAINANNAPQVYAGTEQAIYFDGINKFRFLNSKVASVQGGGVSSGSHSKSSATGTYQLNAGELTLRMGDGSLKKRTLFLGKADAVMVAIDGRIYFQKDVADTF